MKKIILDTSFIMAAARQKVDFFHDHKVIGYSFVVPEQTIRELKGLGSKISLKILENNKEKYTLISSPGKDADNAIIAYAKKNPGAIVATLDQGLQKKLKNKKLILRQRKKIEIV